ncbi:MAG TPA: DUF502 domain-containing protein [Burkholderiales bacterium]|nr:DUF502 domain-containing protein [Burkholderiales bacterium]
MKKYLITGLLIWIPLAITIWVLELIVSTMDQSLLLLPPKYQPHALFGHQIPGLGALLTVVVVFVTGVLASNILGQRLVLFWERILGRIPVVKTIYTAVKQVSDTLFAPGGQAFSKALLVQYPRQGCWTIAFLTGKPGGDLANHLRGDYVSIYLPTTPNPTSGFFLVMPRADVIELDMSVDEALKYVISMGVVAPEVPLPRKS